MMSDGGQSSGFVGYIGNALAGNGFSVTIIAGRAFCMRRVFSSHLAKQQKYRREARERVIRAQQGRAPNQLDGTHMFNAQYCRQYAITLTFANDKVI